MKWFAGAMLAVTLAFAPLERVEGPFGTGAGSVWILRPPGPTRSVVVFAHGWKLAPPSPSRPWVGQFRPWLDHLLADGNAVIFPRYQLGGDVAGPSRVASFRRGLQIGFARLGERRLPVVVVGYSYGASLGFYYASYAKRWGLPSPAAVDSIFPVGPIPGAPVAPPSPSIQVLIEVGDRDVIAGRSGADAWWSLLGADPPSGKRLVVVRSHGGFRATHAAPKSSSLAARQAFWQPLDAIIRGARD